MLPRFVINPSTALTALVTSMRPREVRIPKDEGAPIEFARRFLLTGRGGA
jgi:hypothetical protein